MKKNVKISLLKKGSSIEKFIKEDYHENIEHKIDAEDKIEYKVLEEKSNILFKNKLINLFLDKEEELHSSRLSLIILKEINLATEKRIMIISIGDTRKLVNVWELEENFGIKIGINYSLKDDNTKFIKELVSKDIASGDNFREGKNLFTDLYNFNFRTISNVIKSIKIKGVFDGSKCMFNLNNYISFPINEDLSKSSFFNKIEQFINENYSNNLYKKSIFKFLDDYIYVDEELAEKLIKKMFDIIERTPELFSGIFVWPKFEDDYHGFFTIGNSRKQLFILDEKEIIEIAKNERANFRNIKINSISGENESSIWESLPIEKCIFFEYLHESENYIFNDGKWLKIEKMFLDKVNKDYKNLILYGEDFPEWHTNSMMEKEYNEMLSVQKKLLLLDGDFFRFGGQNKLELADLATTSKVKTLIAVKNIHNSANMSHLVLQVQNSIKAIRNGRDEIERQWNEKYNQIVNANDINTFIIAVATKEKLENNLPKLPFFAKIALTELSLSKPYGFDIKIAWINKKVST